MFCQDFKTVLPCTELVFIFRRSSCCCSNFSTQMKLLPPINICHPGGSTMKHSETGSQPYAELCSFGVFQCTSAAISNRWEITEQYECTVFCVSSLCSCSFATQSYKVLSRRENYLCSQLYNDEALTGGPFWGRNSNDSLKVCPSPVLYSNLSLDPVMYSCVGVRVWGGEKSITEIELIYDLRSNKEQGLQNRISRVETKRKGNPQPTALHPTWMEQ